MIQNVLAYNNVRAQLYFLYAEKYIDQSRCTKAKKNIIIIIGIYYNNLNLCGYIVGMWGLCE